MTLRSIVFALGALAAMNGKVLAQDSVAYVDDRSDGAAVVRSLYNAINRKEYARAYARTVSVEVKIGKAKTEAGAGSIYSVVPVAVKSVEKNARIRFFADCYVTRIINPSLQVPPFTPYQIEAARLREVKGPLEQALPAVCNAP